MGTVNNRMVSPLLLGVLALVLISAGPAESEIASGTCLQGHAYVAVGNQSFGAPNDICAVRTDCPSHFSVGPVTQTVETIAVGFGATTPLPAGFDVTCFLP